MYAYNINGKSILGSTNMIEWDGLLCNLESGPHTAYIECVCVCVCV